MTASPCTNTRVPQLKRRDGPDEDRAGRSMSIFVKFVLFFVRAYTLLNIYNQIGRTLLVLNGVSDEKATNVQLVK